MAIIENIKKQTNAASSFYKIIRTDTVTTSSNDDSDVSVAPSTKLTITFDEGESHVIQRPVVLDSFLTDLVELFPEKFNLLPNSNHYFRDRNNKSVS